MGGRRRAIRGAARASRASRSSCLMATTCVHYCLRASSSFHDCRGGWPQPRHCPIAPACLLRRTTCSALAVLGAGCKPISPCAKAITRQRGIRSKFHSPRRGGWPARLWGPHGDREHQRPSPCRGPVGAAGPPPPAREAVLGLRSPAIWCARDVREATGTGALVRRPVCVWGGGGWLAPSTHRALHGGGGGVGTRPRCSFCSRATRNGLLK